VAKEKFIRSKPRIFVTLSSRYGFPVLGAKQLLGGEPMTDPADRARLAALMEALSKPASFPMWNQALTRQDTLKYRPVEFLALRGVV